MFFTRPFTTLMLSAFLAFALKASPLPSVIAQQPPAAATEYTRGVEFYKKADYRSAVETLRRAIKQDKSNADAWHYLGLALNHTGKNKDARKAFEQAVNLRPDSAASHTGLAYTLYATNKLADAERAAQRALTLDKTNAEAHYVLGGGALVAKRGG